MRLPTAFALAASLLAAACSKPDAADTAADSPVVSDSMAGMPGMGASTGGSVAQQMEVHMKAMKGVSADSLKAMLPMHRQMAANLIASFTKEMRDMNMAADAAWSATVDSLRADLRVLPDLSASELQARMPAHESRITRLIQMHQTMMKNMKM